MENTDVRKWHYLRALKQTAVPTNIMVVDTETVASAHPTRPGTQLHKLRIWCGSWCLYKGGKVVHSEDRSGVTQESFWRWADSKTTARNPLWIFTHNAGFDLTVLGLWSRTISGQYEFVQWDEVNDENGDGETEPKWIGCAVLDDPPNIIKMRIARTVNTIVIVDTFNYFRCSLDKIGASIGTAKTVMPSPDAEIVDWEQYCRNDVNVTAAAVLALIDFVKVHELGRMPYTVSQLAMNAYRCKFLPSKKSILVHGNRDAINMERDSYHGGLAQCWYVGKVVPVADKARSLQGHSHQAMPLTGPVYCLDAKSFYPSIMQWHVFPARLDSVHLGPSLPELEKDLKDRYLIASVILECKAPGFPVTRNGKVNYAVGRIKTCLAGPELDRALEENAVKKIVAYASYDGECLFKDFVSFFYDLRCQYQRDGDKAFEYICKLILNSLYGKFGQCKATWQAAPEELPPAPFGLWWEQLANGKGLQAYRSMAWLPQIQTGKAETDSSCPAIASYVTAYGREKILEWVRAIGQEHCLYSDTDSLHVVQAGYSRACDLGLVEIGKLGKLQLAHTWQEVEYRGPKNYTADGVDTICGIKTTAVKVRRDCYQQPKFDRLNSILQSQQLDGIGVQQTEVKIGSWQPPGEIGLDGRVSPLKLNEW